MGKVFWIFALADCSIISLEYNQLRVGFTENVPEDYLSVVQFQVGWWSTFPRSDQYQKSLTVFQDFLPVDICLSSHNSTNVQWYYQLRSLDRIGNGGSSMLNQLIPILSIVIDLALICVVWQVVWCLSKKKPVPSHSMCTTHSLLYN